MLRNIHLHGALKKQFGPVFQFDIETAGEAFRALNCAFPGKFVEAIRDGSYQIIRGRRHGGFPIDSVELLTGFKLGNADLHIIPVATGSSAKGRGTAKTIIGVAIIGAAIFFSGGTLAAPLLPGLGLGLTWGSAAALGVGTALMGVGMMKAPSEAPEAEALSKQSTSFSFNGPMNTNAQGGPVPLTYGQGIFGTTTVSSAIDIEDMDSYHDQVVEDDD